MRILGVDPGTIKFGYGIVDVDSYGAKCVAYGCLEAKRSAGIHNRLLTIYRSLEEVVTQWKPDHLAVEEPFVAPQRGAKAGVAVGQAQALALLLAAAGDMEVHRYAPSQVKRAVSDYGAGSKAQVQRMVQMGLGIDTEPMSEDTSDALAVALCHIGHWRAAQRVLTA